MVQQSVHAGQYYGNYLLLQLLGKGGFAQVFLAEHVHLKTLAAIKFLHVQLDSTELNKFKREARIIARLKHPNIVQVFDFGVHDGLPYLVMEYAPKGTLRQRYPRGTLLSPQIVYQYLAQLAQALDFAHSQEVIHRDVKPENMLIAEDETILLSDFGIATGGLADSLNLSQPGVAGTPYYTAPEQLRGKPRPASDQYALGIVAYEWLTGQTPFRGSLAQLATQHLSVSPLAPSQYNPDLPLALDDVLLTVLNKRPDERFSSVEEFAQAFGRAIQPGRVRPRRASSPASQSTRRQTIDPTLEVQEERPLARRREGVREPLPRSAKERPPQEEQRVRQKEPLREERGPLTRRTVLVGLGGLVVAGGAGLTWWVRGHSAGASHTYTNDLPANNVNTKPSPTKEEQKTPDSVPTAKVIDIGTTLAVYEGHTRNVLALAWSPKDDLIASGGLDQTVQVWQSSTKSLVFSKHEHTAQINTIAWSPNGQFIASGGNDRKIVILSSNGDPIRSSTAHSQAVTSLGWSSDGRYLVSGSLDKTVKIWNASTGELIRTYTGHQEAVNAVAWSPNDTFIASASSDTTVHVWRSKVEEVPFIYKGHTDFVSSVVWSLDGKRIVSGSTDKNVRVWDALDGGNSDVYSNHQGAVFALSLSTDGAKIASTGSDKTVHLWKMSNLVDIYTYKRHVGALRTVAWSPDGSRIASGGDDHLVHVWQAV